MKIKASIVLGLLSFLFYSCNKEKAFDCVKSTGEMTKEVHYYSDFSKIVVNDNVNLIFVQDVPYGLIVEAGKNLQPKISIKQNGKTLTIENDNTCNWVRRYDVPINIYIGINQVKEIRQNGYGRITSEGTVTSDTLTIVAMSNGTTDISIKANYIGFIADQKVSIKIGGEVNKVAGIVFKNAKVDLSGLKSSWAYLQQNSLLDLNVYCDSLLQAKILGKGKIRCGGNPSLVEYTQEKGKGSLVVLP